MQNLWNHTEIHSNIVVVKLIHNRLLYTIAKVLIKESQQNSGI